MSKLLTTMLGVCAVAVVMAPPATAQSEGIPRTPSGRPDLSGTYDTATVTPLQLSLIHISEPTRPY